MAIFAGLFCHSARAPFQSRRRFCEGYTGTRMNGFNLIDI